MDINSGEYNYYKYDTKDNTFQYFEVENAKESNGNVFLITTIAFAVTTLASVGYIVFTKVGMKKGKRK